MKELLTGETYNKSYIAIPIAGPVFEWVQRINEYKKFYYATIFFLGRINDSKPSLVKEVMSSIPEDCNRLSIIPDGLKFIGEKKGAFILKIRDTEELLKIKEILEKGLAVEQFNYDPFMPHITIEVARNGRFSKYDKSRLSGIPDRSEMLGASQATAIGLYYRTEEGTTALLFSKKL